VRVSTWRVPLTAAAPSVYDTVEFLERALFCGGPGTVERAGERTPLGSIVTLHNADGIRDIAQIEDMIRQIRAGGEILHHTGLPNVKLVVTEDGEHVLFDGHHTVLAYMAIGRDYLEEIPHLIVHGEEGWVADRDILVFFGDHSRELLASNWREHVVNWQEPYDRQLCRRAHEDMGEVFDSLVASGLLPARPPAAPVGAPPF
jgi:hypothetical protein